MNEISGNTVTNIIKGISRRLTSNQRENKYRLGWIQEKILKHQEDKQEKKMEIAGLKLNYIRPYEVLHTYKDIFENEIYKFSASSDRPLIIDCGSNIGISVLYYKKLYPGSTVIAYEPDKKNFQLLSKNISDNNLQQVRLHEAAVWVENGEISFASNAAEGSSITMANEERNVVIVPAVRLADILNKYEKIDFLKLDIEGAEDKVVADCGSLLSRIENLFLEYHGTIHETEKLTIILKTLRDCGFSIYLNNAANHLHTPFYEKKSAARHDVQLNLFCYK
jgi:FkbM family methyltransferase